MNVNVVRTLQVGIAVVIVAVVTIAILVITGFLTRDAALAIAIDVGSVIAVSMAGAVALIVLFGIGRDRGES